MKAKDPERPQEGPGTGPDVSVIRPRMTDDQVRLRTEGDLWALGKALRTLHTLELMAVTIYRFQITSRPSVLNRHLVSALCNEMTHYQDFQVKLYEYGLRPDPFRWAFWMVGLAFGLGSRLLGPRAILRTGVWVEAKAVAHYGKLLSSVPWDPQTRAIVEKDRADEQGHIDRWRGLLAEMG